jgi:hypothetical protein
MLFSGCADAAAKNPIMKGTKCVVVCDTYDGSGGCQNWNPNVCSKEVSPGVYTIYSWPSNFQMINVQLPYEAHGMAGGSSATVFARLAAKDSDCAAYRFYNPNFDSQVRSWYPPNDHTSLYKGNYEGFIQAAINYNNKAKQSFDKCNE